MNVSVRWMIGACEREREMGKEREEEEAGQLNEGERERAREKTPQANRRRERDRQQAFGRIAERGRERERGRGWKRKRAVCVREKESKNCDAWRRIPPSLSLLAKRKGLQIERGQDGAYRRGAQVERDACWLATGLASPCGIWVGIQK